MIVFDADDHPGWVGNRYAVFLEMKPGPMKTWPRSRYEYVKMPLSKELVGMMNNTVCPAFA